MIAYNTTWLYHLFIHRQADAAERAKCITRQEAQSIKSGFEVGFYYPGLLLKIGLFLLALVFGIVCYGLIGLIFIDILEENVAITLITFSLLTYTALEISITRKPHFHSGIDDAWIWLSAGLLFAGLSFGLDASPFKMCLLAGTLATFFAIRFVDKRMAVVAFLGFTGAVYYACGNSGGYFRRFAPVIIMVFSLIVFLICRWQVNKRLYTPYRNAMLWLQGAGLLVCYLAVNYFVVWELAMNVFHLRLPRGGSFPFATVWWILTAAIPIVYIAYGLRLKDRILFACGLLTAAGGLATMVYYNRSLAVEAWMIIIGAEVILVAAACIRWLKDPRGGIVYKLPPYDPIIDPDLENVAIAETFSPKAPPTDPTQFGGGSFGGAGAGNDF